MSLIEHKIQIKTQNDLSQQTLIIKVAPNKGPTCTDDIEIFFILQMGFIDGMSKYPPSIMQIEPHLNNRPHSVYIL